MTRTRIHVIHPEPSARVMLTSMLRALGYEPVETGSDGTAPQVLPGLSGLVLIGVDLAAPDALEILSSIRRSHPKLPVILLSTRTHPERIGQALRSGATSVLRFPLPANQLQSAVVQALGESATVAGGGPPEERDAPPEGGTPSPGADACEVRPAGSGPGAANGAPVPIRPLKESLEAPEREFILQALRAYGWNRRETATALDINRTTLFKKMKKYGLFVEERDRQRTRHSPR